MEAFPGSSSSRFRPTSSGLHSNNQSLRHNLLFALLAKHYPQDVNAWRNSMLQAQQNPEAKNSQNNNEIGSVSVAPRGKGREPIFYDFLAIMEKNDLQRQAREAKRIVPTTNNDELEDVSTELRLGPYDPCITNKRKEPENLAFGNKRMKLHSHEVEKEGGVSMGLTLGFVDGDPWVIKKMIDASDIDVRCARLVLEKDLVQHHIMTLWEQKCFNGLSYGVRVAVWDCDTKSEHLLVFKLRTTGNFVFFQDWVKEFVIRRGLKEGDVIGLYWDQSNSRFNFRVLKRNFNTQFIMID